MWLHPSCVPVRTARCWVESAVVAVQRKGGIVSDVGVYAGFCSHFNIGSALQPSTTLHYPRLLMVETASIGVAYAARMWI